MTEPQPVQPGRPTRLVMLGDAGAAVCEDDSCLLPGAALAAPDRELEDDEAAEVEPGPVG